VRFFVSIALLALVSVPVADAQVRPDPNRDLAAGGSPLSLENGTGTATVRSREGTIVGKVRRGRVRVVNGRVGGCEIRRRINRRTVVCIGRELTFGATGRNWVVRASGSGIYASGMLKGSLTIQGTRGTYSLDANSSDDRPWPRYQVTLSIGK
jgi:hypothetical protein